MLKSFIIDWNNKWRFDYWYRDKYEVAFNSPEHRMLSPIDVKRNFIEETLISREREKYIVKKKDEKVYEKTGQWLKKIKKSEKEEQALFDLVDFKDYSTSYGTKKD